ncbi:MAG: LytTR family DNA-binding domain-containing protein [Flavitalea sp.]
MKLVAADSPSKKERFLVRTASKMHPISLDEIAYFYSDNRLNFLATREGQRFAINYSMEWLVTQLPETDYFRISRSFIVSYKCIEMIQVQDRNRLKVLLTPAFKTDVFVSRDKVSEFRTWVGE